LTKGGSGGGGEGETKVRGDFKETAFWQGSVTTDAGGKASVTFKLPTTSQLGRPKAWA